MPTRGMERWLTQRMSERLGASDGRFDGVCANVDFPSPRRLVGDAVAAASGIEPDRGSVAARAGGVAAARGRRCVPRRAVAARRSPLISAARPTRPIRSAEARRLSTVRHLADLFDRYALHRPEMVAAGRAGSTPTVTAAVPADAAWQPELWRRLRARIALPESGGAARERVRADARGRRRFSTCPQRISLFGLTRASGRPSRCAARARRPAGRPPVLAAPVARPVGDGRGRERKAAPRDRAPRATTRPRELPANRLLAPGAVMRARCSSCSAAPVTQADTTSPVDSSGRTRCSRGSRPTCAPTALPPGAPLLAKTTRVPCSTPTTAASRSTPATAARARSRWSATRSCTLLAEDPTLEPRDVIVMCPDIETFAPLIQATFGAGEVSPDEDGIEPMPSELRPVDLRVRLADRSLRQTNPVLGVVAELLELARAAADGLAGARPRRSRAGAAPVPAR